MYISKYNRDNGMTILEVVLAITLLMICVTYILRSNFAAYKYTVQIDVQQQLTYYAQGAIEAALINPDYTFVSNSISDMSAPYNSFSILPSDQPLGYSVEDVNPYLQKIRITVKSSLANINQVTLYTYRLKPES
ncbi:hypothetical protein [Desulfosporosinus sp. Sb-LF]|uniref:type IV pilus modification PilV family protein n=1 Tax=Desulfosporosinus sp. Sb-LF TaxID=2560027 RepID=UPI00107FC852|nr:hypothetical protein [Desulfosporosinus sp. Sb-LF]TGE34192.1 hypothetical protein E4K68_00325 [Desulfosporosinus sp. Sb-LF]